MVEEIVDDEMAVNLLEPQDMYHFKLRLDLWHNLYAWAFRHI